MKKTPPQTSPHKGEGLNPADPLKLNRGRRLPQIFSPLWGRWPAGQGDLLLRAGEEAGKRLDQPIKSEGNGGEDTRL